MRASLFKGATMRLPKLSALTFLPALAGCATVGMMKGLPPDAGRLALYAASPDTLVAVAEGRPEGGHVAALPQSERFHWLTAPASTIVQPSPVHTGFCDDPERRLAKLFEELVI